jgi:hypothetical protein
MKASESGSQECQGRFFQGVENFRVPRCHFLTERKDAFGLMRGIVEV